ncbi:Alpha-galactosidase A, partial [termite gut metagenome]
MKKLFVGTLLLIIGCCLPMKAQAPVRPQVPAIPQKFEHLADTPPMGWNSWNKFACNIDESLIRTIADALVETGLRDAGYIYLNLDDCWHGQRDSLGFIQPNPAKFPSGMKALADYVHSKGLKIGIYSDAGRKTCGGHPGSFGHEYQDALQYAKWEIDYLKYDWCSSEDINPIGAYNLMRDALKAAGRPILFSMCEWGQSKPWTWAHNTGHSWRTTGDICNRFDGVDRHPGWAAYGVLQILDMQEGLRQYAGPGHWNDPDMLEVGNGQSVNEDRAHFSMWCLLAAPLILGNDIRSMTQETKDIL